MKEVSKGMKGIRSTILACVLSVMLVATSFSSLVACSPADSNADTTKESTPTAETTAGYTAGTYTGVGTGNGGDITVEVTFSEDTIESIDIVSESETPTIATVAYETLPDAIIEYQSLGIDTVAGATLTTMGLKNAVSDAVSQAGGDVKALEKAPGRPTSTEVVDMSADAIVIGGGAAGMSATIRLQELGKSVILVEKTARLGGSVSISGGNQVVTGSALQVEEGVSDDSAESMIEDFQKNGEDACIPELIGLYANNVGPTTDWLNQYVGIEYATGLHDLAEYSHNRELAYEGGGAGAAESFKTAVASSGAEVLLSTTAETLVTDGSGAVTGVTATAQDGTTYNLSAESVIVATGGYGNADEWLTEELQNALYYGLMSSTGDGLTMATADDVDAATRMLEYAKQYPNGVEVSAGRAKSTIDGNILVWAMSAILVNAEGERVVNEKASNHDILHVELEQTDSMLYLLMDQENFDVWREKLTDTGFSQQAVDGWLEANGTSNPIFAHADSLDELAKIMGMEADTLKGTVVKYNAGVQAGEDEFGRTGDYLAMEIGDGPYYLIEQKPRYASTMGGLVVNDALQVMNNDGTAITGLYAAGEVVGGVHGTNSPSGANNGWAITSGKLVADSIAGE